MSKNLNRSYISKHYKGTKSENGVALVMVLGLLTVMVLMAVTFAITMRTERLAAGNYADTVRARELVHVGLARALNQLVDVTLSGLGSNGLATLGSRVYPFWAAIPSSDLTYTNTSVNVYLVFATNDSTRANEATNYVPRTLWSAATNVDYDAATNHFDWVLIVSPVDSNIMGRVKYLILNCSGLLDANFVGGTAGTVAGVTRVGSSNPADIAIGNLEEIAGNFLTKRGTDVRYETMGELNALAGINKPATNLFVYSRALPGYWNNGVVTQVNLSGTAADMPAGSDRWRAITNAFYLAGFSGSEAGVLYRNLIDYIDPGSVPELLTTSVESVPMINEVVVSNNVIVADGSTSGKKYTINTTVFVECWYPFVTNASGSFELNSSVTFSAPGLFVPDIVSQPPVILGSFSPESFIVKICCSKPYGPYDNIAPAVDPVKLISTVTLSVKLGADIVDQITVPVVLTNENNGINNNTYVTYASAECLDPRFNADSANTSQWRQAGSAHTLYGDHTNTWTKNYFSTNNDNNGSMYVANQPLKSVAELGYLVYSSDAPWHTVKLYGTNLHRVLDVFGLSTNTSDVLMTNTVYRGLVNCNPNVASNATAVVFADMPIDQYPGEGVNTLLMPAAQAFVSRLFAKGICTNLSDIGRNLNLTDFQFPAVMNELQREAYFRNSINLLNLRQNVFMIIIEAQAASGGNIPRNPAKQRAVVIVWRDPYTGEMFIRHIKWLGD